MVRVLPTLCLALGIGPLAASLSAPSAAREAETSSPECAARVAARVQAYYERVQDLQADFTQTTQSVTLGPASGTTLEARGQVVFAKPGRMRWVYQAPEPSLVVTDGETLWIYDPGNREAQRMAVTGAFLSGAAIQFLLGEGDLQREFAISSPDCTSADEGAPGGARVALELLPRTPAHYEKLLLSVDGASGQVHETVVRDLFGNRTRVELRDVETDRHPKADLFRFDPPAGVRVIDLGAQPPTQ